MKKVIVILFSLWVVWTQTPLASRCEASVSVSKACACCSGCSDGCGCMTSGGDRQVPLPLAAPWTSIQTELLFPAAPASMLALSFANPADNFLRSPSCVSSPAVPIFCRDCALLL